MQLGVIFPQTEIGSNPSELRVYVQGLAHLGLGHVMTYEHVLGARRELLPEDYAPYALEDPFHEPFTLFSYLAALAPQLEFATGILVLPQRQTALVAKQAAQVDLLTRGRLRLGIGIGWNNVEFEGMGIPFSERGARMEEQIHLLRALWTQEVVDFEGAYHHLRGSGIRPLPVQRPIPIWIGGFAEAALRRAARLADGLFPLRPLAGGWSDTLARVRQWREEAGLSWEGFGIEARVSLSQGEPSEWRGEAEMWRELGATHLALNTMGCGLKGAAAHLGLLEKGLAALGATS